MPFPGRYYRVASAPFCTYRCTELRFEILNDSCVQKAANVVCQEVPQSKPNWSRKLEPKIGRTKGEMSQLNDSSKTIRRLMSSHLKLNFDCGS